MIDSIELFASRRSATAELLRLAALADECYATKSDLDEARRRIVRLEDEKAEVERSWGTGVYE